MNTREMAEEYRLSHWAGILRERKESGLSIRAYCKQAGFHENVFYYWQRKLRQAALAELSDEDEMKVSAPEDWALCTTKPALTEASVKTVAMSSEQLTVEAQGLRITAGSAYPVEQLAQLLRKLMNRC